MDCTLSILLAAKWLFRTGRQNVKFFSLDILMPYQPLLFLQMADILHLVRSTTWDLRWVLTPLLWIQALKSTILLTENHGNSASCHQEMSDKKTDKVWVVTPVTSGQKVAGCSFYWTPIVLANSSWFSSLPAPESFDSESH